jgi:pimeloyl-ACP methyl ester carboxylesterase
LRLAVKVYDVEPGTKPVKDIILIHGTGARAEMWRDQIDRLTAKGYRCFVPDLRGHGETHEPGEHTDIHVHLSDVVETLSDLDINFPAVFAGHSLGSIISLELAQTHPQFIEKILAVSMPGKVPGLTTEAFKWFLGWPFKSLKGSVVHRNLAWREKVLLDTHHFTLSQVVHNFAKINYAERLPVIKCPVHFAVGRLDPVAPYFHVESMHRALPGSTVKVIEWAGHNCMDSQPEEFNRWFFEKLEDNGNGSSP